MENKVAKVFRQVLNLAPGTDVSRYVYNETEGWDSVAHMMIVAGLEESFDCMLDMDDIIDMRSYARAVDIMAKYA